MLTLLSYAMGQSNTDAVSDKNPTHQDVVVKAAHTSLILGLVYLASVLAWGISKIGNVW